MSDNDPSPLLLICVLCFSLAWLIARFSLFYRTNLRQSQAGRTPMIDGLRGWLALSVFFTHATVMRMYFINGQWGETPSWLYGMVGQIGVSLFFMITGFLFWGQVLRSGSAFNVDAFYISRIRRIFPMYLCSVALVLIVVAVQSNFELRSPFLDILRQLRAWLSFGFIYTGDINGIHYAHAINAVYWTLAFEWGFYIALPMIALLSRYVGMHIVFLTAVIYCIQAPVTLNFLGGALSAFMLHRQYIPHWIKESRFSLIPIFAFILVFNLPSAYAPWPVCLMLLAFLFIVGGNSLFGILGSQAAKLLGTISYSMYLNHCIILYVIVGSFNSWYPIIDLDLAEYWLLAACSAALTIALSSLSYRVVEHPFLKPTSDCRL